MGIKGLEKFIRTSNTNISRPIDIRHEIEKWRRDHGRNPIIIVDVKEIIRMIFRIDEGGLILGGRYQKVNEILDYFFREMKKANADLIFFVRLREGKQKDVDRFQPIIPLYDAIIRNKSLKYQKGGRLEHNQLNYKSDLCPSERILFNFMHEIGCMYGRLSMGYGSRKRGILAFARENRENVMCVITRNTEFLIAEDDFQYWSLSDVQFAELKIAYFSRQELKKVLGLNVEQMQLLHAITQLDMNVSDRLIGDHNRWDRLFKLCDYVENQVYGPNGFESQKLTGNLTEEDRNFIEKELTGVIQSNNYSGNWNEDILENDLILDLTNNDNMFTKVLGYCKSNIYFAYKLMNETLTVQKDLLFIDIRRPDALPFIDLVISVTMKLCGILFKDVDVDKQPKTRTVRIKRIFGEEIAEYEVDINYPTMELPGIHDLLIEEQDKSFDPFRWRTLEWVLGLDEETMAKINGSSSKKELRIVLMTLKFLLFHQIISPHEADVLLLTEFDGRNKGNVYVPRSFCPPPPMPDVRFPAYVDILWVQTAHKYTIAYELLCHSLEVSGLRKETDMIELDACKFHDNMNLVENGKDRAKVDRLMGQIEDIRLW